MRLSGRFALASLLLLAPAALPAQDLDRMHHQEHPESSPILAAYDFERPSPSGPDTFWIRQHRGGGVALSDAFRVGGERSLHISEVEGNRDFAEFLAYFTERREGDVYIQFYLLLTDPEQRFNFGLAGERWFLSRAKYGHAIWLQSADGVLRDHPHGGWRQLFAPRPFAWYFVDIVYHVASGTYDLRVVEEGLEEPVVDLFGARSFNGHEGSSVRFFSLIGDLEDAGRFDFFVDDLLIATLPEVRQKPFVAPGRRSWFVERFGAEPRPGVVIDDLIWEAEPWIEEVGRGADQAKLDALEAAADQAFFAGRLDFARRAYARLAELPERSVRSLLKLADVAHRAGETTTERELRESIYGRLDTER